MHDSETIFPGMTKAGDAFRSIGEMAEELGVKPHILRYWEEQFPTLTPLKRAGGRRHYRAEDAELLRAINQLLNGEGYTIKGARRYLAERKKSANSAAPSSPAVAGPVSEARLDAIPADSRGQFSLLGDAAPCDTLSPKAKARLREIRDILSRALADSQPV